MLIIISNNIHGTNKNPQIKTFWLKTLLYGARITKISWISNIQRNRERGKFNRG